MFDRLVTSPAWNTWGVLVARLVIAGIFLMAPPSAAGAEKLIAFFGDQFVIVDCGSFKISAKGRLPEMQLPDPQPGDTGGEPGVPVVRPKLPLGPGPVSAELHARVLYALRANQIFAINIDTGAITAKGELPKPQPIEED